MPLARVLAVVGLVVFSLLALTASVSVNSRFDPAPLVIIVCCAAASAYYVLRVLPRVRAAEEARRAAAPRRRPARPPAGPRAPGA